MALTIQGADIGYDANEVQTALNNIRAQVIEEAQNQLRQQISDLENSVDEIWVGKSADNFKKNMQKDVNDICKGLDETYEMLKDEFNHITARMANIDATLVDERND